VKIVGVDFTSAPGPAKPIVSALCTLDGQELVLEDFREFSDWPAYEAWLGAPDAWIGGFDFPFGLPRRFVEAQRWGSRWPSMLEACARGGKDSFARAAMRAFQGAREKLDKHRRTDLEAGSESPLKTLANPPVGKMFYEGAWRLLSRGLHVPMLHETDCPRIAVEAYPGLLVERLGERYYKNDRPASAARNLQARKRIVRALEGAPGGHVPARLVLRERALRARLFHPGGDWLDAVICAMQAAWAWQRRSSSFGLPAGVDPVEGWIVGAGARNPR
jgi:hypothetical protein